MEHRLGFLRRSPIHEINERKKDFLYMNNEGYNETIHADGDLDSVYRKFEQTLLRYGVRKRL